MRYLLTLMVLCGVASAGDGTGNWPEPRAACGAGLGACVQRNKIPLLTAHGTQPTDPFQAVSKHAGDRGYEKWLARWEARVNEAENSDAKARDMVADWCWDNRSKLDAMDVQTLIVGQRIVEWMKDHDIPLPSKVKVQYEKTKLALEQAQHRNMNSFVSVLPEALNVSTRINP